jgi:hypothetical protein
LFNNILNIRLDNFFKKNRLIHQSQIGFTQNARTADHVFILKTLIDKYCQSKNGRDHVFILKTLIDKYCQSKNGRDHVFILKTLIDKYCQSKNGRLYACFVDFHKVFASVIHVGLKLKLLKMNVGTMFYRIIANMYEHSRTCVKVGGSLTESFFIKLGVRKGDNLSLLLFKFFIDDFPSYLDSCTDTVLLHSEKLNCLMYAE